MFQHMFCHHSPLTYISAQVVETFMSCSKAGRSVLCGMKRMCHNGFQRILVTVIHHFSNSNGMMAFNLIGFKRSLCLSVCVCVASCFLVVPVILFGWFYIFQDFMWQRFTVLKCKGSGPFIYTKLFCVTENISAYKKTHKIRCT